MNRERVPITGIVVVCNEDERLRECLESLHFCDEVLVVNLESDDRSVEIAEDCGAEVIHHERLPVVEQVRTRVVDEANHDWVLFIDPDEIIHPNLFHKAASIIQGKNEDVGRIFFPWKFYFRGKPLEGTRWGGRKYKGVLVHRDRCLLTGDVHRGIELKDNFRSVRIPWENPDHHIRHYWIDSTSQLFEKHLRYIQEEGSSRYRKGQRFSWSRWVKKVPQAFKRSLFDNSGWREGATGLFLSFFSAWYEGMSLLSLRRYEKKVDNIE